MVKERSGNAPSFHFEFFKIYMARHSSRKLSFPRPASALLLKHRDMRKFGDGSCTLTDHNGQIWPVRLGRAEEDLISITDGWQEFARHHCLSDADLLIFKFEGGCSFQVQVFGRNGLRKENGFDEENGMFRAPAADEEIEELEPELQQNPDELSGGNRGQKRSYSKISSERTKILTDSPKRRGRKRKKANVQTQATPHLKVQRPIKSVRKFKSSKLCFQVVISRYYLPSLHIPRYFARRWFQAEEDVTLRVGDETWPVRFTSGRFSRGWRQFFADNSLKEEDICRFQLIEETALVLEVDIQYSKQNPVLHEKASGSSKGPPPHLKVEGRPIEPVIGNTFKVVINKNNLRNMHVPSIVISWFKDVKDVRLVVGNKSWPVAYVNKVGKNGRIHRFIKGWPGFVKDNSLQYKDVCLFEFIKEKDVCMFKKGTLVLGVHINCQSS